MKFPEWLSFLGGEVPRAGGGDVQARDMRVWGGTGQVETLVSKSEKYRRMIFDVQYFRMKYPIAQLLKYKFHGNGTCHKSIRNQSHSKL